MDIYHLKPRAVLQATFFGSKDPMHEAKAPLINDLSGSIMTQYCPDLDTLTLWQCPKFGDKAFETIAANSTRLTRLRVHASSVSDVGVKALADRATRLQELSLRFCSKVTDAGLLELAAKAECLEKLYIGMMGGIAVEVVGALRSQGIGVTA